MRWLILTLKLTARGQPSEGLRRYHDFNAFSPAAAGRADHEIERSANGRILFETTPLCLFNFEPTAVAPMPYFYRFLLFIAVVVVVFSACVGLVKVMG
jgi:hypothetical protein